jgi:nitrogen fixation protein FixH
VRKDRSMVIRWALIIVLVFAAPALAGPQGHGHSHRGGQEVRIGIYEVELVVKASEMVLHVNDTKDRKVDVTGFTATAVVLAKGNQTKTVELTPAGENRLAGKIDFATQGKFRAAVTLRSPAGEVGKVRYNLDVAR